MMKKPFGGSGFRPPLDWIGLKYIYLYKKWSLFFYFVSLICRIFNSETSINFSSMIGENFVKTHNLDSYDVIMM